MEFTQNFLQKGMDWVSVQGVSFLGNLIAAVIIFAIGMIVSKAILRAAKTVLHKSKRVSELLEKFALNVLGKLLWAIVFPIILGQFGISRFFLGFAFQDSLSNLLSGVMISLNNPFRIGDYIDLGSNNGTVKDMDMMCVTLYTPDNKKVIIANKLVWGSPIINYSVLPTRRIDMVVGISYGTDIAKAKKVIWEQLEKQELILKDPLPKVEVVSMGDSSVNLVVRPWCNNADYWTIYFALNHAIKDAFDQEGIEIPFPQLDVHHYGLPETGIPVAAEK